MLKLFLRPHIFPLILLDDIVSFVGFMQRNDVDIVTRGCCILMLFAQGMRSIRFIPTKHLNRVSLLSLTKLK